MVGITRDLVSVKLNTDRVFTIVWEMKSTPGPSYPDGGEEGPENPHVNRLWKMASAWRVISFFLLVFVLPTVLITLPLYARYHLYHTRHLPMTETDTMALNYAVSSFWCQGQRVTSNGTLDAFLVAGSPRVQKQRRHVSLLRNLTLRHDDIEYWGVYLLEGSDFTLSSSARWPGGTLLVVKGEENLRKCFYREDRLQEELNGVKAPVMNVFKNTNPDNEELADKRERLARLKGEEEDGSNGGEVFDDDQESILSELRLNTENQRHRSHETDFLSLPIDRMEVDDYLDLAGKNVKPSKKEHRRKNRKGKKKNKGERKEKRSRRNKSSVLLERIRRDSLPGSSDLTQVEKSADSALTDQLNLLHKFNDTLDVTTGNSSFSSSEEFLEQCKDTLLTVDLSPYLNWQDRVKNLDSSNPDAWHFHVDSTDYYYFIFTSDNNIEINHLAFNLELERATYDVSSPIEACHNSTECVFPLAFTQTESVVVEVPANGNLSDLHAFEVTTTCQHRVPVYMVFILLVPLIIMLFAFQ